jgi:hypothetical protein
METHRLDPRYGETTPNDANDSITLSLEEEWALAHKLQEWYLPLYTAVYELDVSPDELHRRMQDVMLVIDLLLTLG